MSPSNKKDEREREHQKDKMGRRDVRVSSTAVMEMASMCMLVFRSLLIYYFPISFKAKKSIHNREKTSELYTNYKM